MDKKQMFHDLLSVSLRIAGLIFFFQIVAYPSAQGKQVIGWLETVLIYPGEVKMRAKLDTGAKSSAVNVLLLNKIERNGETWVSFELQNDRNKKKRKTVIVEKKVVRTIKIKKKGGGLQERYVVMLEICLGGMKKQIKASLVDRSNFNYQVLIGRDDLADDFLVDPDVSFSLKPFCKTILNFNTPTGTSSGNQE